MKDNFPAFPNVETALFAPHSGMTLRDYFASNATDSDIAPYLNDYRNRMQSIETARYMFADSMMEARK
jgi:hypothetical protein